MLGLIYFQRFDILMFTETFQRDPTSLRHFYCYETYAKKGERGRPYGGLVVAIKPELKPCLLSSSDYHLTVESCFGYFICCYFSPTCDTSLIIDTLEPILNSLDTRKTIIVGGDFNCRVDQKESQRGKDLIGCLPILVSVS